MEYSIYVLDYDLGSLFMQQAVVSTTNSERATSMLEEFLDQAVLRSDDDPRQLTAKNMGFRVRMVYETEIKTDTEKVIVPVGEDFIEERLGLGKKK